MKPKIQADEERQVSATENREEENDRFIARQIDELADIILDRVLKEDHGKKSEA